MIFRIFNFLTSIINWILELSYFISNCLKLILFHKKRLHIPLSTKEAFVIGNGPSFNSFYEHHKNSNKFLASEKFVCNGFVNTEFYEVLKPENYILSDPLFFDLQQEWHLNVWRKIFENTTWDLTIWTSEYDYQKIKEIINDLPLNKNISIKNLYPIRFQGRWKYKFLSMNLGKINGVTVSHFMIQMAILKDCKNIFTTGIDHDGIENYNYDYELNKVYYEEQHINSKNIRFLGEAYNESNLLHELEAYVQLLKGYMELLNFCKNKRLNIYRVGKSYVHFIPFLKF